MLVWPLTLCRAAAVADAATAGSVDDLSATGDVQVFPPGSLGADWCSLPIRGWQPNPIRQPAGRPLDCLHSCRPRLPERRGESSATSACSVEIPKGLERALLCDREPEVLSLPSLSEPQSPLHDKQLVHASYDTFLQCQRCSEAPQLPQSGLHLCLWFPPFQVAHALLSYLSFTSWWLILGILSSIGLGMRTCATFLGSL